MIDKILRKLHIKKHKKKDIKDIAIEVRYYGGNYNMKDIVRRKK